MKKLASLKMKGVSVDVKLTTGTSAANRPEKFISVYEDKKLLYSVKDGGFNNSDVIFGDDVNDMPWYMIKIANEIIENFDLYWIMLNQ